MKIKNTSDVDLVYDDPVTNTVRKITAQTEDWCQPSANLPAANIAVLDDLDGYGKLTRRIFVSADDVAASPTLYNAGSIGQQRYMDEFIGVGNSQSLHNHIFKRTEFQYADPQNPTKWTQITETEQREH